MAVGLGCDRLEWKTQIDDLGLSRAAVELDGRATAGAADVGQRGRRAAKRIDPIGILRIVEESAVVE